MSITTLKKSHCFPVRSIFLLVVVSTTSLLALPSKADSLTVAVADDFGAISTGDGNWDAKLGHKGTSKKGTFDISIKRPEVGKTVTGNYKIDFTSKDEHNTTATYSIDYSVKYILVPGGGLSNYWNWTLTPKASPKPDCADNLESCGDVSATLYIDLTGKVEDENGTWETKTQSATDVSTVKEKLEPSPAPLPLLGVAAAFTYSRKLRLRIKSSNTPEVLGCFD